MEYVTAGGMLTAYTCSVVNIKDQTRSTRAGPHVIALIRNKKKARLKCRGGAVVNEQLLLEDVHVCRQ
jgi:hypothetical protein